MNTRFSNLLLEILHCDPALPNTEQLLALSNEDWHEFTAEAIHYRMAFQVKQFLDAHPKYGKIVPPASLDQLSATVRQTLMYNLRQQAHLRQMLEALNEANISVMLLKGLWLGEVVYRDLKARNTGDIDLLLHSEDMPRFTKLVLALGFDLPSNIANICELAPASNEFTLIHPTRKSVFDIHWTLTRTHIEKPVDEVKFWQRSEIYTIAGKPCRSLCLEDHLLYLCFHTTDHHRFNYVGPRALLDIASIIDNPPRPIDWNDVVVRAKELDWERGVWLMLDLTQKSLGSQIPKTVLDELCPAGGDDPLIHSIAMKAIFLDQPKRGKLNINIARLAKERSILKQGALFYQRTFPPPEEIATRFKTTVNSPGFRWLYFKRIGLLIKNHVPKIMRLTFRNSMVLEEKERILAIDRWMDGDAAPEHSV